MSRFLFSRPRSKHDEVYGVVGLGKSFLISSVTIIIILLAWWWLTWAHYVEPLFLPSPEAVIAKLVIVTTEGFGGGRLIDHVTQSLQRVFSAFMLACLTAVPLGLLMEVNRFIRGVFDPPIEFYRPIPPLAYLPLTIIWLGIGEQQKIVLIYLAMFAPLVIGARAGARSVQIEQIHVAYSMGASPIQVLRYVIVMGALPHILTSMRIAMGFGWTTLVAAEMVAAKQGLGFMILQASEFLVTDVVMMGILIIGFIGYAFDRLMCLLERWIIPWRGRM